MMLSSEVSLLDPRAILSTARKAAEEEKVLLLWFRPLERKVLCELRHGDLGRRFGLRRAKGMRHSFEAMLAG